MEDHHDRQNKAPLLWRNLAGCSPKRKPLTTTRMPKKEEGPAPSATAVVKETSEDDNLDEVRKWDDLNNQALGNIRLRLHYSIQHKYRTILTAGLLWEKLAEEYNQPGIMTVYLDFKAIMDTPIPDNADPSLTIDKIMALFGKLHDNGVQIPSLSRR
jgi:hypothetical protein